MNSLTGVTAGVITGAIDMLKPRIYQSDAVQAIWDYFYSGKDGHPIVAMPTGVGKSIVIAAFLNSIYDKFPTQRVMMLTHVKELIEQNYEKLISIWPNAPAGVYSSGLGRREAFYPITFAGIQSVAKKAHIFGHIDIIIIDECHTVSPNMSTNYRKFIYELMQYNPNLKVIGLTATPFRLGQGMLTDGDTRLFTDICINMCTMDSFNWFIKQGYLAPLVPKRTKFEYDVDGVGTSGGEFIQKELQRAVDRDSLTERAVKEMMEESDGRRSWLIFCAGLEHAYNTRDMLRAEGITSEVVDGAMGILERQEVLRKFKNYEIQAVCNNNVLTTGFDHPGVDLMVILRPTQSSSLWVQMLGRGTRPVYADGFDLSTRSGRLQAMQASTKQNCLVLDFSGNTRRLGPVNDPLIPNKKGKKGKRPAPVKECPVCGTYCHASAKFCTGILKDGRDCDHEFKFETKLKEAASTEALIAGELPIVEDMIVDHIVFSRHRKDGVPDSVKITYHVGFQRYTEYKHFEHTNQNIIRNSMRWWRERLPEGMDFDNCFPHTTDEALERINGLNHSTSIRVWTNKKYPEIILHCLDGTHFGKHLTKNTVITDVEDFGNGDTSWQEGDDIDWSAAKTQTNSINFGKVSAKAKALAKKSTKARKNENKNLEKVKRWAESQSESQIELAAKGNSKDVGSIAKDPEEWPDEWDDIPF